MFQDNSAPARLAAQFTPATGRLPAAALWRGDGDHDALPAAGTAGKQTAQDGDFKPMSALLETHDLSKTFGGLKAVQKDRPAHRREPDRQGVIGPNGAGKTTLFNCLSGIYRPEGGSISLDGQDITGRGAAPSLPAGAGPDVPEHPALSRDDGAGKFDGRAVPASLGSAGSAAASFGSFSAGREPESRGGAGVSSTLSACGRAADEISSNLPYGLQRRLEIAGRWRRSRACCCSTSRRRG